MLIKSLNIICNTEETIDELIIIISGRVAQGKQKFHKLPKLLQNNKVSHLKKNYIKFNLPE